MIFLGIFHKTFILIFIVRVEAKKFPIKNVKNEKIT